MPYVVDASIAACWCFRDEEDPRADRALSLLNDDHALVPPHWWYEIRNVLLMGERRQRITRDETALFLDRLARAPIHVAPPPTEDFAMNLARTHRLTFYDAVYLDLAAREGVPLATLDQDLAAAARADGIALI